MARGHAGHAGRADRWSAARPCGGGIRVPTRRGPAWPGDIGIRGIWRWRQSAADQRSALPGWLHIHMTRSGVLHTHMPRSGGLHIHTPRSGGLHTRMPRSVFAHPHAPIRCFRMGTRPGPVFRLATRPTRCLVWPDAPSRRHDPFIWRRYNAPLRDARGARHSSSTPRSLRPCASGGVSAHPAPTVIAPPA